MDRGDDLVDEVVLGRVDKLQHYGRRMETSITFRDARRHDVAAIVAMYADDGLGANREHPQLPLDQRYLAAFAAINADPRHRLIVGEVGGLVVATLQLSFIPQLTHVGTERAQIEAVRVAATARGQGVGGQLVAWAIEESRRHGCGMIQLTTNTARDDARRFYESLGFVATHHGMKLALD